MSHNFPKYSTMSYGMKLCSLPLTTLAVIYNSPDFFAYRNNFTAGASNTSQVM